jgi:hypothetical protein
LECFELWMVKDVRLVLCREKTDLPTWEVPMRRRESFAGYEEGAKCGYWVPKKTRRKVTIVYLPTSLRKLAEANGVDTKLVHGCYRRVIFTLVDSDGTEFSLQKKLYSRRAKESRRAVRLESSSAPELRPLLPCPFFGDVKTKSE